MVHCMVMAGSMVLVQQLMEMALYQIRVNTTMAGDPTDTANWGLPRYCGGGNVNVFYQGIQSKDSSYKYLKNTGKYTDAQLQAVLDAKTASSEASAAGKSI